MTIRSLFSLLKGAGNTTKVGAAAGAAGSPDIVLTDLELLAGDRLCGIGLPSYSLDIADYTGHYFPDKEMAGDERCR
jgi:hypothetical protein